MSSEPIERAYILDVCTSCREPGTPREPFYQRPGYKLFHALKDKLAGSDLDGLVELRPAECLSICPRPCGIAISSPGSWAYLFGDQDPGESVEDIMEALRVYLNAADGVMRREDRPKGLRRSILGRIPPNGVSNASF